LDICLDKFTVPAYLSAKSKAMIDDEKPVNKKKEKEKEKEKETVKDKIEKEIPEKIQVSNDILHPELYKKLRSWRIKLSKEQGVPAYVVLSQMALMGITNMVPQDSDQLLKIPGVGKNTLARYGEDILQIVRQYIIVSRTGGQ